MRSFVLLFCLLAVASAATTTTTTVAAVVTTTSTVASVVTTTSTVASTAPLLVAAATTTTTTAAPSLVFDFAATGLDKACTKAAVVTALNNATCNGFLDLAHSSSPSALCDAACDSKAGAAFVQSKCPPKFAAQAALVCAKSGDSFLFSGLQSKISTVQSAVFSATTAPSLTCDVQTDYTRKWLLADPAVVPHDAIFEAICQKSASNSCWSSFFGYLKANAGAKELATAATTTSNCATNGGCSILAAGLFAKYVPAATAQQGHALGAIQTYSVGACVESKKGTKPGLCGVQSDINTNLVAVASTFSINANSFFAGTYVAAVVTTVAPSAAGATTTSAATTTAAPTTTKAPTTTTTTAAAAATTTTTTTTTAAQAQQQSRRLSEVSSTTRAATTSTATSAATGTSTAYPWVAVLKGITDQTSACAAVAEYNKIGCCGAFVGQVSALLGGASDSTLATAALNLVGKVYPIAETYCRGVVLDPTCQEGTAPSGDAAVQSVTITFALNGVTCTGITNPVVAAMGEGMAMSFVAAKIAPSMDAADVAICSKSFREAKAALVKLSRRRLQTASAALTVKGTASDLAAITDTKDATKGTAALAVLNTALVAAVQAGAAKALADPDAAADFAKYVDTSKLSVTPVTAADVSAPTAVAAKEATSSYTATSSTTGTTVSGAPAAMSAIFAPVCAVAAMFASA